MANKEEWMRRPKQKWFFQTWFHHCWNKELRVTLKTPASGEIKGNSGDKQHTACWDPQAATSIDQMPGVWSLGWSRV